MPRNNIIMYIETTTGWTAHRQENVQGAAANYTTDVAPPGEDLDTIRRAVYAVVDPNDIFDEIVVPRSNLSPAVRNNIVQVYLQNADGTWRRNRWTAAANGGQSNATSTGADLDTVRLAGYGTNPLSAGINREIHLPRHALP